MKKFLFMSFVFAATALSAVGVNWKTDYNQALQESQQTGKPVLLFFTGSDWCGWCKRLDKEVFQTPEFVGAMGDKLIFVELDFPMSGKASQQHQQLRDKHGIKGYPTVILIDGQEKVLGRTGYQAGGGKSYATHLQSFLKN